jgi:hypothetical protein
MHLSGVFGGILNVVSEKFAQTTELGLTGILETELECLEGSSLIHDFQTSIVLQDLEDSAVGFPQEFEPRGDNSTVGTVLGLFAGNCSQKNSLGSFDGFEIVDVGGWRT